MRCRLVGMSLVLFFTPFPVSARVIHVNDCLFTIGSFCPIESVGFTIVGILLLSAVGYALRSIFRMFGGVDKRGYSPSPAEKIAYIANELLKQLDLSAAIEKAQNSARLATERGDHDVAFVWKQVEMHLAQSSTKM
jgi:hypothetical protein